MARVKFKDGTTINFKGEPSSQDIEDAYNKIKISTPSQRMAQTEKGIQKLQKQTTDPNAVSYRQRVRQAPQQVEKLIQQRPDAWEVLKKELAYQQTQPRGVFKDPMTPFVTGLKTMAVPFQRGEAAISAPVVAAQQGRFGDIPEDIYKAVIGKRQAELGDIARQAGIPDPYAAAAGFGGSVFLTNKLLSMKAPKRLQKAGDLISSGIKRFGRQKGVGIVRQLTGMTREAVEHVSKKGGHKVFVKKWIPAAKWQGHFLNKIRKSLSHIKNKNVRTWAAKTFGSQAKLDTSVPYKQTLKIQEGLKQSFRDAIKRYGDDFNTLLDDVAKKYPEGKMPIERMSQALQRVLQKEGIIGGRGELLKFMDDMTPMQKELVKMNDDLASLAQGKASISLKDYVKVRRGLWKKMKTRTKQGDIPYGGDEHAYLELIGELDDVIPKNISDDIAKINAEYRNFRQVFNPANKIFKPFKGKYYTKGGEQVFNDYQKLSQGEKVLIKDINQILPREHQFIDDLGNYTLRKSYKLGVDEAPKATGYNKLKDYWKLTSDEKKLLQHIDDSIPENLKFLDDFKDFSATQEALVKPATQGVVPYWLRILGEAGGKYGTRQFLRFREPVMGKVRPTIPPSLLREVSKRNK